MISLTYIWGSHLILLREACGCSLIESILRHATGVFLPFQSMTWSTFGSLTPQKINLWVAKNLRLKQQKNEIMSTLRLFRPQLHAFPMLSNVFYGTLLSFGPFHQTPFLFSVGMCQWPKFLGARSGWAWFNHDRCDSGIHFPDIPRFNRDVFSNVDMFLCLASF